jgi:hypothetical protein
LLKSKLKLIISIALLLIAIVLLFPLKDGASPSAAARNAILDQIPPALDILAQRHPIQIGLVRAALNQDGQFDTLAQAFVGATMDNHQSPSLITSYETYYAVLFNQSAVQNKIADTIEQQFGLSQ